MKNSNLQGWETKVCIGIDVAKEWLDVAIGPNRLERFPNDVAGHDGLVQTLRAGPVDLIVLEATGGFEFAVACALQAAGVAVAIVNPRQAREFAKAMGLLAKTDRVDARLLAQFAEVLARHPERARYVKPLPDAARDALGALVTRRRQLLEMLTAERNRLSLSHALARPSLTAMIEALKHQLDQLERELKAHVNAHHAAAAELLRTVKGVGPVLTATLLSGLPELGRLPAHGMDHHERAQPSALSRPGYGQPRELDAVGFSRILLGVTRRQRIGSDFRQTHCYMPENFLRCLIVDQNLRPR